ncbi:MAG: response regulator [Alphaproteobacteria bacterium]|nr:MAG: response regulator [Alphaproteobacteria bacterium]
MRSAILGLLRAAGYQATGFGSAEDFLAADDSVRFSCIVSDIQMPGISGLELKRTLAADGCDTPVVLITARSEADLTDRARESGALCLLRKPFEADSLLNCIDKALAG